MECTAGKTLACEEIIVISPSFGEGLETGVYCFICMCYFGPEGEDVLNSSRMCWLGIM